MRQVDRLFVALKGAVVYKGKLLLLQESSDYADGIQQGRWDMPGGRVTPGESWVEALKREIKEETGLEATIKRPFFIGEWWPKPRDEQWQVIATFVTCEAVSDQVVLSTDHQAFKWVAPTRINESLKYAHCIEDAISAYSELE